MGDQSSAPFVSANRARRRLGELVVYALLILSSLTAVAVTAGIVFSLAFEAFHFFQLISWQDFLFGSKWSPQTAIRADQVGSEGSFGVLPLLVGTMLISTIAMVIATPLGLASAIYLALL